MAAPALRACSHATGLVALPRARRIAALACDAPLFQAWHVGFPPLCRGGGRPAFAQEGCKSGAP
eukprot:10224037-Alexandrium_andersonii.AAC.1